MALEPASPYGTTIPPASRIVDEENRVYTLDADGSVVVDGVKQAYKARTIYYVDPNVSQYSVWIFTGGNYFYGLRTDQNGNKVLSQMHHKILGLDTTPSMPPPPTDPVPAPDPTQPLTFGSVALGLPNSLTQGQSVAIYDRFPDPNTLTKGIVSSVGPSGWSMTDVIVENLKAPPEPVSISVGMSIFVNTKQYAADSAQVTTETEWLAYREKLVKQLYEIDFSEIKPVSP